MNHSSPEYSFYIFSQKIYLIIFFRLSLAILVYSSTKFCVFPNVTLLGLWRLIVFCSVHMCVCVCVCARVCACMHLCLCVLYCHFVILICSAFNIQMPSSVRDFFIWSSCLSRVIFFNITYTTKVWVYKFSVNILNKWDNSVENNEIDKRWLR